MSIDAQTLHLLQYQGARRRHWLGLTPPDRDEAKRCLERMDDIIDRRPRVFAVTPDGETIYDNATLWEKAQVAGEQITLNDTGRARDELENHVGQYRKQLGL